MFSVKARWLGTAAACGLSFTAANAALAQDQPPPQVTTLRAVARAVLLDVLVVDRDGHSVKGLKQSDFTLTEDGVPQQLNSFEEHTGVSAAEAARLSPVRKLPPNEFSNFQPVANTEASTVFLLDALDSPVQAQAYLREQMIAYMKAVPPGTPIAIFQLDSGMHLVQGFSTDPDVLLKAVQSKRDEPKLPPLSGPGNYAYNRIREDILMNGMHMMARYLAGFPGRKNLIWCTGHLPRSLYGDGFGNPFPDTTLFIDDMNRSTDELRLSRVAVYPIDARGLETDPASSAANPRMPSIRSAPGPHNFFQNVELEDVAEATGGKAYYNTNGLKQAIGQIIENGSNYYTISYTPTNTNWNGAYRKIKVEVSGDPAAKDVRLQYRRGYYAHNREYVEQRHAAALGRRQLTASYNPAAEGNSPDGTRGPKQSLDAAMGLGAIPSTELIFDASITPGTAVQKLDKATPPPANTYLKGDFAKKPFRYYRIIVATQASRLKMDAAPDGSRHGQIEVVAVVYTDKGETVNSLISTSLIDLRPDQYARWVKGFVALKNVIAVPVKGNYFLRLGVHDVFGNRVGATEIPVEEIKLGIPGPGQTLEP